MEDQSRVPGVKKEWKIWKRQKKEVDRCRRSFNVAGVWCAILLSFSPQVVSVGRFRSIGLGLILLFFFTTNQNDTLLVP